MWQEYLGKKIICTPFDEDDDGTYNNRGIIEFMILRVIEVDLNTVVYVMNSNFECEWIYPAEYTVIEEQIITDPSDTWYQYIGKKIITRRIYRHDDGDGENFGDPREFMVLRTRDMFAMIIDYSAHYGDNHRSSTWIHERKMC